MLMRFPGGLGKALTLSYDDGVEQDITLMGILDKYGIKCTFNLNSGLWAPEGHVWPKGHIHRRMTFSRALELYMDSGHEVAVHGATHASFTGLSGPLLVREVLEDRKALEDMFHTVVRGAAYPYGAFNAAACEVLKNCGIEYCRTVNSTHRFQLPDNWLTLHPTCHHDDPLLGELTDRFLKEPAYWDCKLFYLWGHSYEFEDKGNWQVIEDFAAKAGGREDVWYCTNIQAFDYTRDFGRLVFSADGRQVVNPTASRLWFSEKGTVYEIGPGAVLRL